MGAKAVGDSYILAMWEERCSIFGKVSGCP